MKKSNLKFLALSLGLGLLSSPHNSLKAMEDLPIALMLAEGKNLEPSKKILKSAIRNGWIDRIQVNNPDDQGATPLHYAAGYGDPELVVLLIKAKANVNAQTKYGKNTPLHFATSCDLVKKTKPISKEVIKILIQHGAMQSLKNSNNQTPLDLVPEDKRGKIKKVFSA